MALFLRLSVPVAALCALFVVGLAAPSAQAQSETETPSSSHGQNHGPRAGQVINAGAVMSEVVWRGGEDVKIYFISAQWMDLEESDVSVTASLVPAKVAGAKEQTRKEVSLKCSGGAPTYTCKLPLPVAIKLGDTLRITRKKKGAAPTTFDYMFPPQ